MVRPGSGFSLSVTIEGPSDPRAMMAARNNADWYAMMWDIRGLRYRRDAFGFVAVDPPPAYHGWVVALPGAPIRTLIAPLLEKPGFGVKDAAGLEDLSALGLTSLFDASWIWHPPLISHRTDGWEEVTTTAGLAAWEDAWRVTSPTDQRQFPDAILDRTDVAIWGRRVGSGYDAGVIANLSEDCVGLSNLFGAAARPAATALCATFGAGKPVVGYEREDDLAQALAAGWRVSGPLRVWT